MALHGSVPIAENKTDLGTNRLSVSKKNVKKSHMKILSVSDYVIPELYNKFNRRKFQNIDLILSCGDLPPEYLSFLLSKFNVPLYYVKGNHDIRYKSKPPMGCFDLHGKIAIMNGVKIFGLEGSRWYNGGPNQYTEEEMKKKIFRLIPALWWHKGFDIIITHAPPRFIHDREDPCHKGFRSFNKLIAKYKPKYFIHGHIHKNFINPSKRVTLIESTKVINTVGYNIIHIDTK